MFNRIVSWFKSRSKRTKIVWISVIVLVIGLRIALPHMVKHYLERELNDIEGYSATIEDVDLHLYRGGVVAQGVKIYSTETGEEVPLFFTDEMDVAIQWSEIFNGAIVARVELNQPMLNFVVGVEEADKSGTDHSAQTGEKTNNFENVENVSWQEELKSLLPITVNKLIIKDGEIHYKDLSYGAPIDVYLSDLNGSFDNLTNTADKKEDMYSTGSLTGKAMGHAYIQSDLKFNPLDESGSFDLDLSLEKLNITQLNDFTRAYAKLDVESGEFNMYTEIAADNGQVKGYVKPITKNMKVLSIKNDYKEGFVNMLWQGFVGVSGKLFTNIKKNQLATKVEFSGKEETLNFKVIKSFGYLLSNVFIKALDKKVDGTIQLEDAT